MWLIFLQLKSYVLTPLTLWDRFLRMLFLRSRVYLFQILKGATRLPSEKDIKLDISTAREKNSLLLGFSLQEVALSLENVCGSDKYKVIFSCSLNLHFANKKGSWTPFCYFTLSIYWSTNYLTNSLCPFFLSELFIL